MNFATVYYWVTTRYPTKELAIANNTGIRLWFFAIIFLLGVILGYVVYGWAIEHWRKRGYK